MFKRKKKGKTGTRTRKTTARKTTSTRRKNPPKTKARARRRKNPPGLKHALKPLAIAAVVGGGVALATTMVRDAIDSPKLDKALMVGLPIAGVVAGIMLKQPVVATSAAVLAGVAALNVAGLALAKKGVTATQGMRLPNPLVRHSPARDANDMRGVLAYYGR